MQKEKSREAEHRIVTIPNLLSLVRLLLIPLFVWLYCVKGANYLAMDVLILSGLTDLVDGFIARRFHMVTALGKALDPIADKLTQGIVLICLGGKYPLLFVLVGLLAVKEIVSGIMCLKAIRKTKEVKGADWHGKITTCLLYLAMILHIIWKEIPQSISIGLIVVCSGIMILSFVLYFGKHMSLLREK